MTTSALNSFVYPRAPWRPSTELSERIEQKSFDATGSFKVCIVPPGSLDFEPIKQLFLKSQPPGFAIKIAYYIQHPAARDGFEVGLEIMEKEAADADPALQPEWEKGSDIDLVQQRKKVMTRWQKLVESFSPLDLGNGKPLIHAKVLVGWHGTSSKKVNSLLSTHYTTFGKHSGGGNESTDDGYFGSGIYFSENPAYASKYAVISSRKDGGTPYLLSNVVSALPPYPVVSDVLNTKECSDMKELRGKSLKDGYNAHFIPVAPNSGDYYPCYQGQEPTYIELVVRSKNQALICFSLELTRDGPLASLQQPYQIALCHAAAEIGENDRVKNWISADKKRLNDLHGRGETLLYPALLGKNLPLFAWLCHQDPNLIQKRREDGRSLLFLAVLGGKQEMLNWMLKNSSLSYSIEQFRKEAAEFGYSPAKISSVLLSIGWSISQVPLREANFIGRVDLLAALENALAEDPWRFVTRVTLAGPEGVGKSTIALEYTHRHQHRYSLIYWIDSKNSLLENFVLLGKKLGIVDAAMPLAETAQKVRSHLETHPGWLLIFDDVKNYALLTPYLPRSGGHCIITSEDKTGSNLIEITPFTSDESLILLSKLVNFPLEEEAKALVEELGNLPVAITQAGIYMRETNTSLFSYLAAYKNNRDELLEDQAALLESR